MYFISIGRLEIGIDILPEEFSLGIFSMKLEKYCDMCECFHEARLIQVGLIFFSINFVWN
jgi:hypothetical protein